MSNWKDLFSFFIPSETPTNPTKREVRRPVQKDKTDSLVCNSDLTKNLYHNSYPGMKLAGGLAYAPIVVPVWFMGIPIPVLEIENEKTQSILDQVVLDFAKNINKIHIQSHRDGTCWVWPHYSATLKKLIWEFISDDSITDIIKDINNNEIIKIITDEEMQIVTGYNKKVYVRRKRTFEKNLITVQWVSGKESVPTELMDITAINPSGILPIPFANNVDGDRIRGYSDYERLITDLKDYHDIELKQSEILAKFNPKLAVGTTDVDQWKKDNAIDDFSTLDIEMIDLLFYKPEIEKPPLYVFPERAHEAYEKALKRKFKKMVEESMIPEIAWGVKVEGNLASADKQIEGLVKYVEDKRAQHNESYKLLFEASLRLMNIVRMRNEIDEVKIEWNKLDAISEETKSIIFKNFAQGISYLIQIAGLTKEQLHKIWKENYPHVTEDNYDEFIKGISQMGAHKQWKDAQYVEVMDMQGGENDSEIELPEPPKNVVGIDDKKGI